MFKFSTIDNFLKNIEKQNSRKKHAQSEKTTTDPETQASEASSFLGEEIESIENIINEAINSKEENSEYCILCTDEIEQIREIASQTFAVEYEYYKENASEVIEKLGQYGINLESLSNFLSKFDKTISEAQEDPQSPGCFMFPEESLELIVDALYPEVRIPEVKKPVSTTEPSLSNKEKFDSSKEKERNVLKPESFVDLEETFFGFAKRTLPNRIISSISKTAADKSFEDIISVLSDQQRNDNKIQRLVETISAKSRYVRDDVDFADAIDSKEDLIEIPVSGSEYTDLLDALEKLSNGKSLENDPLGLSGDQIDQIFKTITGQDKKTFNNERKNLVFNDPVVGLMSKMKNILTNMTMFDGLIRLAKRRAEKGDTERVEQSDLPKDKKRLINEFSMPLKELSFEVNMAANGEFIGKEESILSNLFDFLNGVGKTDIFSNDQNSIVIIDKLKSTTLAAKNSFAAGDSKNSSKLLKNLSSILEKVTKGVFSFTVPKKPLGISGALFLENGVGIIRKFQDSLESLGLLYSSFGSGSKGELRENGNSQRKEFLVNFVNLVKETMTETAEWTTTKTDQDLLALQDAEDKGQEPEIINSEELNNSLFENFSRTQASDLLIKIMTDLGELEAYVFGEKGAPFVKEFLSVYEEDLSVENKGQKPKTINSIINKSKKTYKVSKFNLYNHRKK